MYAEFWGFKVKPFENTANPLLYYMSPQHEEALIRLYYAIKEKKGAAMLTGGFGTGKTTVSHTLIAQIKNNLGISKIANINYPRITSDEFLWKILKQMMPNRDIPDTRVQKLEALEEMLIKEHEQSRHTVIIIDEAHLIDENSIYEELRLLLNLQRQSRFMLTLILIGQPELKVKIDHVPPFKQRISIFYHLKELDRKELEEYIQYRVQKAGGSADIFGEKEVLDLIYEKVGGAPRAINNVCDTALLAGFINQQKRISVDVIKNVIEDFARD